MRFHDRIDAGEQLAERLTKYAGRSDAIVLGLPRGGVPVATEFARRLHIPLDACLVRKLGVPGHPEVAMGAIAAGGIEVLSHDLVRRLQIPHAAIQQVAVRERLELDRRDAAYRGSRRPPDLRDRPSFWPTTASPPDRRCRPPSWRSGRRTPRASWSQRRLARATPAGFWRDCRRRRLRLDAGIL